MEELVAQIQQGRTDLLEKLWLKVEGLIAWYAALFFSVTDKSGMPLGGTTINDLIQCGYFALLGAVKNYDPGKAKFTTFLLWYCRREFQIAMGRRSVRTRNDPLNKSFSSLDAPIDDDEERTLLDVISESKLDEHDDYSAVEDRIYYDQLHALLEELLEQLPEKEADAIRLEFFKGMKLYEIGEELGCSYQYARSLRQQGLNRIRHGSARTRLEKFIDLETDFYGRYGLRTTENIAVYRERLMERYEGNKDQQNNTGSDY